MTDAHTEEALLTRLVGFAVGKDEAGALARYLLARFGSLASVLDADTQALNSAKGMSRSLLTLLKLIPGLTRKCALLENDPKAQLKSTQEMERYLRPYFIGCVAEEIYVLMLDKNGCPLCCQRVNDGDTHRVRLPQRRLMEQVMYCNAAQVVLAHNHPSGIALPSREDVGTTLRVGRMLGYIGVSLRDHLILVEDDFVSLRDSGILTSL